MPDSSGKPERAEDAEAAKYSEEYFRTRCAGSEEYRRRTLPRRYHKLLQHVRLPVDAALDLGCGRGEATVLLARSGCKRVHALDFSQAALDLTRDNLREHCTPQEQQRVVLLQANANSIPLEDASCDLIVQLDLIEHLGQEDIDLMLGECSRILRPGGVLLLHTSPNIVLSRLVTFPAKVLLRLKERPAAEKVHISMQSGWSLARNFRKTDLSFRMIHRIQRDFWFEKVTLLRGYDRGRSLHRLLGITARAVDALWLVLFTPLLYVPGIRNIVCNNFVVIAEKPGRA